MAPAKPPTCSTSAVLALNEAPAQPGLSCPCPSHWDPSSGIPAQAQPAGPGCGGCPSPDDGEHAAFYGAFCTRGSCVGQMRLEFYDSFTALHCR